MTQSTTIPAARAGHSNAPQGSERTHTLIIFVHERPGAVDRVVGVLRRRRANLQTLVLGRSEVPDVARISVQVNDSEVMVEHLVEQMRKVVDVRQVISLSEQEVVARELALIKVASSPESFNQIIELGNLFGAHAVDITPETVTLEVTGSSEKIEKLLEQLQSFSIREIARSGHIAMARA